MKIKQAEKKIADCGIIVGRFQIDQLHKAHVDLIQGVCDLHPKVIIFLGVSPCMVTKYNPLDFESRKQMILEKFPSVNVLYIKDTPSDKVWSQDLDGKIGDLITPNQTVTLYGSRDSFIKYYSGKYPTQELLQEEYISASEVRNTLSKKVINTPQFRAGVIWAAYNKYPITYPTVDIAIIDGAKNRILLGRKRNEDLFRFVGGFAEPNSESYEEDARREVMEETGLEISAIDYVGSFKVDDWRYRKETDQIKTLFFIGSYCFGKAEASDDLEEVKWFDLDGFDINGLVPCHKMMFKALLSKMEEDKYIEDSINDMAYSRKRK